MSDPERYVPPPPPYELSLQHDQKVVELQTPDSDSVSKAGPFRDREKDSKHSTAFSDKCSTDAAIYTLPSIPKYSARSVNGNLRAPRPLPPSPADTHSRSQGSKLGSVAEVKSYAVHNDHETEPYVPAPPPFSAKGLSLDEASYAQSMLHPSPSVHPSPFHYPSQPSYDTPRQGRDDQWLISAYSPMNSETSFRRSSHMSSLSPSYSLPQDDNFGRRMSFDPSVAYSDSQANSRTAFSAQRGVAASLYSSAVSSHLRSNSPMSSGLRQYAPPRPALRSVEALRIDKTDKRSSRPHPPASAYPSSPASLYTPRTRTQSGYGYEQRWAISESDIAGDVYRR